MGTRAQDCGCSQHRAHDHQVRARIWSSPIESPRKHICVPTLTPAVQRLMRTWLKSKLHAATMDQRCSQNRIRIGKVLRSYCAESAKTAKVRTRGLLNSHRLQSVRGLHATSAVSGSACALHPVPETLHVQIGVRIVFLYLLGACALHCCVQSVN